MSFGAMSLFEAGSSDRMKLFTECTMIGQILAFRLFASRFPFSNEERQSVIVMVTPEVTVSLGPLLRTFRRSIDVVSAKHACPKYEIACHTLLWWGTLVRRVFAQCSASQTTPEKCKWLIRQLSLFHRISQTWACNEFLAYSTLHVEIMNLISLYQRKSSLWFHRTFAPFRQRFSESIARNPTRQISSLPIANLPG